MNRNAATHGRLALLALALPAGCGFLSEPAVRYELSSDWAEVSKGDAEMERRALELLTEVFGTPREPVLLQFQEWTASGFDPNRPDIALGRGGSGELGEEHWARIRRDNLARFEDELLVDHYPSLAESAHLYAERCATCHGNEGGGDGPGSRFLTPPPRDFRQGVFKFTSRAEDVPPTRSDLVRILEEGIQNTSMPSFSAYSAAELHGLADYIRFLAVRGESELWWLADLEPGATLDRGALHEAYRGVFEDWRSQDAGEVPLGEGPPSVTPELLELGRAVYHDEGRGNCVACHGVEGGGLESAGVSNARAALSSRANGEAPPAFRDAWGHEIVPRDLERGPFRYGDSPEDVFRRIYAGINGTPMPGIGTMTNENGEPILGQRELWALSLYTLSLREGSAARVSKAQNPGDRAR